MVKVSASLVVLTAFLGGASALVPNTPPRATKAAFASDAKRIATNGFMAASLASALVVAPIAQAVDMMAPSSPSSFESGFGSSTMTVSERVIREGMYKEYEIDLPEQAVDNAKSNFKSAKETKTKKGKYTLIIAILVMGSFVIPMAQYFWYVRDDDSSENFFSKMREPEPEPEPEPPKKKGWFGK